MAWVPSIPQKLLAWTGLAAKLSSEASGRKSKPSQGPGDKDAGPSQMKLAQHQPDNSPAGTSAPWGKTLKNV